MSASFEQAYHVAAESLALATRLSTSYDLPEADILQRRVLTLLDQASRKAEDAGFAQPAIDDIRFALVAFIDEQIFRSPWPGRQNWMLEPLQLKLYQINTAGEEFFQRITRLEADRNNDAVLQVYYLCLTLGFEGKYAVQGSAGLAALTDSLQERLRRSSGTAENLSPRGAPSEGDRGRARKNAPVVAISAAIVLLALFTFGGMKLWLNHAASESTDKMNETSASVRLRSSK